MRTLCDSCEAAAAQFFCAADEAALCAKCDEKVHSCNKLASRHIRLQLREAWSVPRCDICETAPGSFSVCYFSCKLFTGPQILQLSCIVVSMDHPYVFSVTWMFIKEAKELTKDTCCWDREWSFQMDFIIKRSMVTQETWRLLQRIGRKSTVRSTFIVQFPVRKLMLNQMVTSIMWHLVMAKKSENSYYYKGTNILHLKFKEYYRAWCYQLFGSWHVFPCIDLIGFSLAFKTDFHLFIMRFENAYLNIKMFSDLLISLYLTLHCLCHFLFVIAL